MLSAFSAQVFRVVMQSATQWLGGVWNGANFRGRSLSDSTWGM
jgi:hypothetical protein